MGKKATTRPTEKEIETLLDLVLELEEQKLTEAAAKHPAIAEGVGSRAWMRARNILGAVVVTLSLTSVAYAETIVFAPAPKCMVVSYITVVDGFGRNQIHEAVFFLQYPAPIQQGSTTIYPPCTQLPIGRELPGTHP